MACITGSREVSTTDTSSTAAGCVLPEPVEVAVGESVSSRCSISWCSLENPCDGSAAVASIVESGVTPASRSVREQLSSLRPRHRSLMLAVDIPQV